MSSHFQMLAGKAAMEHVITTDDVLALRQEGWGDGKIAPHEAESIFMINDLIDAPSATWSDFFVEAISEYVVNCVQPKGYVDELQADWLIARLDRDGKLASMTELELLAKVIEKATNVPSSLKLYAMAQIERAVLTGSGPTRDGGAFDVSGITVAEVKMLRRILFAQAGEGPASISQLEAEMLFRLKDATLTAVNAPEWKTLFVQGVANYLQAFSSYEPLSRDRARQLEAFMNTPSSGVGGILSRMANLDFGAGLRDFFTRHEAESRTTEVAEAGEISALENVWLEGQIQANQKVDAFDQALLDFLADDATPTALA